MLSSKSKSSFKFKLFFILVIAVMSTSCLRSARDPESAAGIDSSNDFKVLSLDGEAKSHSENEIWRLPTKKTYEYTACLLSRSSNVKLPAGQSFKITRPGDQSVELIDTDDRGCLVWTEDVPFNYSADSIYLRKTRKLEGRGTYRGEFMLSFAVNPWLDSKEVIDLNRESLPSHLISEEAEEGLVLSGFASRQRVKNILIETDPYLKVIHTHDTAEGKKVKIVFRANPYINISDSLGENQKKLLRSGKFRVYLQLVGNYIGMGGTGHVILTPGIQAQEVQVSDGTLSVVLDDVPLNRRIDMGRVQLALKIVPLETPFAMGAYEGLHSIGSFDELGSGGGKAQIEGDRSDSIFNYSSFIETASNFEELKAQGFVSDLPPFFYSDFAPRFVRIGSGETSIRRTIIFRVKTQITDSITGKPARNTPFIVKFLDGRTEEIKTNSGGYLHWFDNVNHLYYQPEKYFFPKYEITHKSSGRLDKFVIAINPWDTGWTFGADATRVAIARAYNEMGQQEVRRSMFMVDAFRYQTIRFRYVIDNFMTLNVKKGVVMTFDPLAQRYTIEKGRSFEVLRDGIYLLKVALVKYFIDPFQNSTRLVREEDRHYVLRTSEDEKAEKGMYTTIVKKLIRVQAGRITTPAEFSMRDLRMMSIRTNLMVQIETIDEDRLMQDNIIDAKLRALVEEYKSFNSQNMTEEEQERFFAEKEALFVEETEKLKESIGVELADLTEQREYFSNLQLQRFDALTDLEDNASSDQAALRSAEVYRNNLRLPEDEFAELIAKARAEMGSMHGNLSSYWGDWDDAWNEQEAERNRLFYSNNEASPLSPEEAEIVRAGRVSEEERLKREAGLYGEAEVVTETTLFKENEFLRTRPASNSQAQKSYLDYLSIMQVFLGDFDIGTVLTAQDIRKMKINNYTENPAAPFIDLNLYSTDRDDNRGFDSGLSKRTFIGPCTLIENDNMSDMRPTDTIDEKYCDYIDCGEVLYPREEADNSEFENSEYHDSLTPFAAIHVDDQIELHKRNELNYDRTMDVLSQMGGFTKAYNLEYVSLTDKSQKIYKDGCDFLKDTSCFMDQTEGVTKAEDFISQLNKGKYPDLLAHFFYANPDVNMYSLEKELLQTQTLEPLLSKAADVGGGVLNSVLGLLTPEYPYFQLQQDEITSGLIGGASTATLHIDQANTLFNKELKGENLNVDSAQIVKWLHQGKQGISLMGALRLCDTLAKQSETLLIEGDLLKNKDRSNKTFLKIRELCLSRVKYLPTLKTVYFDGMGFDQRYTNLKTGKYEHISGKNMNLNVGDDFSISGFNDISETSSLGLNGVGFIGALAIGLGAAAAAPLLIAGGLATALGGFLIVNTSVNQTSGTNVTGSTSVSIATFLVVQKAEMEIELLEHEKCLDIQMSPRTFTGVTPEDLKLKEGLKLSDKAVHKALTRGFMICEGVQTTVPDKVTENYYYVTQHFTAGDMLDDANLLNHIWLLALRGDQDYNTFIETMKGQRVNSKGEIIDERQNNAYPLTHLHNVYNKIHPSFPGMYSVQKPLR